MLLEKYERNNYVNLDINRIINALDNENVILFSNRLIIFFKPINLIFL